MFSYTKITLKGLGPYKKSSKFFAHISSKCDFIDVHHKSEIKNGGHRTRFRMRTKLKTLFFAVFG